MGVQSLPVDDKRYHVYAMLCQDADGPGYIKFGYSTRIGERLSQLRTGCPIPAQYFAVVELSHQHVMKTLERMLHRIFADRRVTGEWFRFDFDSEEDKRVFNDGCLAAFKACSETPIWWTKISISALDEEARRQQRAFLKSAEAKKAKRARERASAQRRAWKELDKY